MKELPTDDPLFGKGPLRADGRRVIPAYLFEVKKPDESKYPWDYYKQIATISPEDAAKPLEASECPLVKKKDTGRRPNLQRPAGGPLQDVLTGPQLPCGFYFANGSGRT
jgi:hypothetical protein